MNEHEEFDGADADELANLPAMAGPDMTDLPQQLVAAAANKGLDLTGENGLLTALTKQVLQSALEVEMAEQLGYDKHDQVGRNRGNSRNGSTRRRSRPTSARSLWTSRGTGVGRSSRGSSVSISVG